jgi:pentapeptide MXKDX repeat protein
MKKIVVSLFALTLLASTVAFSQDAMKQDSMSADASSKAIKVMGKISDDGKSFVGDKDQKTWTIVNPDAVKGHEGHHVVLTAHVYPDKMEVHVMSLKMAAGAKSDSMSK